MLNRVVGMLVLAMTVSVFAETRWKAAVDGSFNDPDMWTDGVPVVSNNASDHQTSASHTITLSAPVSTGYLYLNHMSQGQTRTLELNDRLSIESYAANSTGAMELLGGTTVKVNEGGVLDFLRAPAWTSGNNYLPSLSIEGTNAWLELDGGTVYLTNKFHYARLGKYGVRYPDGSCGIRVNSGSFYASITNAGVALSEQTGNGIELYTGAELVMTGGYFRASRTPDYFGAVIPLGGRIALGGDSELCTSSNRCRDVYGTVTVSNNAVWRTKSINFRGRTSVTNYFDVADNACLDLTGELSIGCGNDGSDSEEDSRSYMRYSSTNSNAKIESNLYVGQSKGYAQCDIGCGADVKLEGVDTIWLASRDKYPVDGCVTGVFNLTSGYLKSTGAGSLTDFVNDGTSGNSVKTGGHTVRCGILVGGNLNVEGTNKTTSAIIPPGYSYGEFNIIGGHFQMLYGRMTVGLGENAKGVVNVSGGSWESRTYGGRIPLIIGQYGGEGELNVTGGATDIGASSCFVGGTLTNRFADIIDEVSYHATQEGTNKSSRDKPTVLDNATGRVNISGGSFRCYYMILSEGGEGSLQVEGTNATVTIAKHLMMTNAFPSTLKFVLGTGGVSPINVGSTNYVSDAAHIYVDASEYDYESNGKWVKLIDSSARVGSFPEENITIKGLEGEIVQSRAGYDESDVWLHVITRTVILFK